MDIVKSTPINKVRFLRNVPLDSSYTDTLTFNSVSAQTSYFQNKTKYVISDMTTIRLGLNTMRVPYTADNLYDCNYIMFQNSNFSDKWFYAFINNITYINSNMSEVLFSLDVWQNWFFEKKIGECWVEREHSNTDAPGGNIVDEGLNIGEYVKNSDYAQLLTDDEVRKAYVVAATFNTDFENAGGGIYGGLYSGLTYNVFQNTVLDIFRLVSFITEATARGVSNGIVGIFTMPNFFVTDSGEGTNTKTISISKKTSGALDGYTPRNKKLYTHPYNFLRGNTFTGNFGDFAYEHFGSSCNFRTYGNMKINPEIIAYPTNYAKGDFECSILLNNFPSIAYVTDFYKAWEALNGAETQINRDQSFWNGITSTVSSIAGGIGSALSGDYGGAAAQAGNALNSAVNTGFNAAKFDAQDEARKKVGDEFHGQQGNTIYDNINKKNVFFYNLCLTASRAKTIDDFFDKYGYATKQLKVPNITGRPRWNYVKCNNAIVTGSIPFGDLVTLKTTLNNGITFWHGDYVGDYSGSNAI